MRVAKPQAARPSGFTLIELLVVIAIIGVLASMIVAASMRVIGMQAEKNTNLLVQKTANAVNARWSAIAEQANNEQMIQTTSGVIPFYTWANLPAVRSVTKGDPRAARLWYIHLRQAQQFPVSYNEARNGPGYGIAWDPYYRQMLTGVPTNKYMQGVCLWLALKNSSNGAINNQDIFTPQETVPIANSEVFCLVDAWRNPLYFTRMPYAQYIKLNPGGALVGQFDVQNPNLYFVPVVSSNGPPDLNPQQPIISYELTVGGPLGGK